MKNTESNSRPRWSLTNITNSIEGDKVIWIIVLLLTMISILTIFSSTTLLAKDETRVDIIKTHSIIAGFGLMMTFCLYKIRSIGVFRVFSQLGFLITFLLLLILDLHLDIPGIVKAQNINGAYRTLYMMGFQLHVFEVAKVLMVLYLAWAIHAFKADKAALESGKKSPTFKLANRLGKIRRLEFMAKPFWKRMFYIYAPSILVCVLIMPGSNSSAIFIGGILVVTMLIGGVPWKELGLAATGCAAALGLIVGICIMTDGKVFGRAETLIGRFSIRYDMDNLDKYKEGSAEFYREVDKIKQPIAAKIAIKEGGFIGKLTGNSTQKYVVSNIYGDYMFAFIIEEYGFIGGLLIVILYVSLLARSSIIARYCENEYAKVAVGGLSFMIVGQAFMHMMVNVGIGPMTGQTLPLVSHGATAFLCTCLAFGVLLSISRMARQKIQERGDDMKNETEAQ